MADIRRMKALAAMFFPLRFSIAHLDLHLAIHGFYVIARDGCTSRPFLDAAIEQGKTREMPWALDGFIHKLAFFKRRAVV
jgi:hypothetical protein